MTARERVVAVITLDSLTPERRQGIPDPDVVVHDVTVDRRVKVTATAWGETRRRLQVRHRCTCGYETSWQQHSIAAIRQMTAHAYDGQLAVRLNPQSTLNRTVAPTVAP